MAVQWFPGHMHLTRKALAERLRRIDVVIEILDARLPGSSANPMLAELTRGKAVLKLLNKSDLADPVRTELWLAHYRGRAQTQALPMQASGPAHVHTLEAACRALAPNRGGMVKPVRVLICGIPNVGKSTLLNALMGRRVARAADEPGVTRREQCVELADDCVLFDTPGVLWPRIIVAESGYWLAASGAVGRNAFEDDEVAWELLHYLHKNYPQAVLDRYELSAPLPKNTEDLLNQVARQVGALRGGGQVDRQKVCERVLGDFRSGRLGRITLETPEQFLDWLAHGRKLDAERQVRKEHAQHGTGRR